MYNAIIIDDEKWVAESLISTLGQFEHFSITAKITDGISALEYLKKEKPDLAFLDIRLPGMNGIEILKAAENIKLPTLFIIISGHADFEYAQEAIMHNAISYCLKPFSAYEINAAVNKAYSILKTRQVSSEAENTEDTQKPVSASVKNNAVSIMLEYINEHYTDDISIQTLADLCSISPSYAGQLFRQQLNQTFSSYLTDLRIKRAIWLLTNTDMPISLIASSVGYQDYFYFAKVFKKIAHTIPSSYRHDEDT